MLLLLISFIAGILTILAPCVLPLLPVIVGGSVNSKNKDRARSYIIAASLAGSIVVFTLALKVSTVLINLSPNVLNYISGSILIVLGLASVLPEAWERIVVAFNWQAGSQRLLSKGSKNKGRYVGPILVGAALGPVFASCSPTYAFILASILPHSYASGLIYLISYSFGLVASLLALSLLGRKLISKFEWVVDTHSVFRRTVGILFIIIGVILFAGKEVSVETWVGNHLPFDETRIERVLLSSQHKRRFTKNSASPSSVLNVQPTPAPEFQGLTNWINSSPQTLAGLRGKVVLVDFWTYSCINCIRSLPYVEKWYQTYADKGFVVIGVNTPEFAFEHNPANVANAVKNDHISYPVALDNDDSTWNAFGNDSWPADYLIDKNGNVRYVSLGEGDYGTTEQAIQQLLGISQSLKTPTSNVPITQTQTPETYFGTNRAQNYAGSPGLTSGSTKQFRANGQLQPNQWTLDGKWQIGGEYITSQDYSASLTFNVNAKDVYMVASPNTNSGVVKVELPGGNAGQFGADAPDGSVDVSNSKLYHIVSLAGAGNTTVTLTVPKGISLYTFTFGS